MPTFEEILRNSETTDAFEDQDWMNVAAEFYNSLDDVYLVESLRLCLMACSMRLVGDNKGVPSVELVRYGLDRVVDMLKESKSNG